MDIHKFEVFVDLAETLSYTDTAERLFTSQGNVSKQIMSLEKELDTQLFVREHRTIHLTEEGVATLGYAQKLVATFSDMIYALAQQKQRAAHEVTIHSIPSISNYRAFTMITEFHRLHPDIFVHLIEDEANQLVRCLDEGKTDMVFMRQFISTPTDYEMIKIEKDRFAAILPLDHPLAHEKMLTIDQLANEKFLVLGKETNLLDQIIKLAQQSGFTPDVIYEGHRIDLIMKLVEQKMGISIMMEKSALEVPHKKLAIIPLDLVDISELCFVRRPGKHSLASDLFWDYCSQQ